LIYTLNASLNDEVAIQFDGEKPGGSGAFPWFEIKDNSDDLKNRVPGIYVYNCWTRELKLRRLD